MDTEYTLFSLLIEDDIFVKILEFLDHETLQNLELASVVLWNFTKRTLIWKRKFNSENPDFFTKSINSDLIAREKLNSNWDEHFKFKRLCLKLENLQTNWQQRKYVKKCYDIKEKFQDSVLKYVDKNYIFISPPDQFFSSFNSCYEPNNFTLVHNFGQQLFFTNFVRNFCSQLFFSAFLNHSSTQPDKLLTTNVNKC